MTALEVKIRIRGGAIISGDASKENPQGKEYPVLHAEVLDNEGKVIHGGVLQIPLSKENRSIIGSIMEIGTMTISVP